MDLAEAVEVLYALPPGEFVAHRSELVAAARAVKDRPLASAVGELRRPSVSAWALNQLARRHGDEVAGLVALGDRLRNAQAARDGSALRDLGRERTSLVQRLSALAASDAAQLGVALSAAVDTEVAETLTAALASPEAAEAVTGGALTRALSYAGFGDVDLSAATAPVVPLRRAGVATPARREAMPKAGGLDDERRQRLADERTQRLENERRRRLAAAEEAERAAAQAAATAGTAAEAAAVDEQEAQQEVDTLRQQLDAARQRLTDASQERTRTSRARRAAEQAARDARTEAERLRQEGPG